MRALCAAMAHAESDRWKRPGNSAQPRQCPLLTALARAVACPNKHRATAASAERTRARAPESRERCNAVIAGSKAPTPGRITWVACSMPAGVVRRRNVWRRDSSSADVSDPMLLTPMSITITVLMCHTTVNCAASSGRSTFLNSSWFAQRSSTASNSAWRHLVIVQIHLHELLGVLAVIQAHQVHRLLTIHGATPHFDTRVLVGAAKAELQIHQVGVQRVQRLIVLCEIRERAGVRAIRLLQAAVFLGDEVVPIWIPVLEVRPVRDLDLCTGRASSSPGNWKK